MYDLVIQIVNYNTKQHLEECLKTLLLNLEDFPHNYKINILDNNSEDDLSDLMELYKENDKVAFYQNHENKGFGAGHNNLAKKVSARYLLILNPDLKFTEPKTVERLYATVSKDNSIKVVGPKLLTSKREVQWWDHGELKGFLPWVASNIGRSYWKDRNDVAEVAWVSGAIFLVEKNIFDKLEGFDENFFMYKEEEDLCLRIRKHGGKIFYNPFIKVLHSGTENKKKIYFNKSREYFLEKHFKNRKGFVFYKILGRIFSRY